MQNLTDRDMGYDILYGTKSSGLAYMEAVLESASPRCREIFHRLHDDCLRSQWHVWQFLHERQEYRIQEAQRQEVDGTRQRMSHLCRTHNIGAHQTAGAGTETGRWESGSRTPDGNGAGSWSDAREGGRWDDREGRWSEGATAHGRASQYGLAGSTYGGPTTGNTTATGSAGGINFEPDRNMPEGTRFESDRGFAEAGAYGATGPAMGTGAGYGATAPSYGTAGTFSGSTGTAARHNDPARNAAGNQGMPGGSWNDRESARGPATGRAGSVSIGARPSESSRRNFGENTWSNEETRKSGRY